MVKLKNGAAEAFPGGGAAVISQLRDKKVIFFDVGYTLDRPASGDWMFTNRFLAEAGDALKARGDEEVRRAGGHRPALPDGKPPGHDGGGGD